MSLRTGIRTILASPLAATLLYRVARGYSLMFRLTLENEQPWLDCLKGGEKVLLCLWHQQFFPVIRPFERYRPYRPSIMISLSQDGALVAGVAAKSGWFPVRGSSSKGARQAFKLLVEKLRETGLAAHILDGPQGPMGKVKNGAIHLAQATGAAIVPVSVSADRAWHFNSWDKFLLPKPFSRVEVRFGDMIRFASTKNQEEMERQRQYLETVMLPCLKM